MARDYGRVHTGFWNSPAIRSLNDRGKLLATYLLTGPHSNTIGAYLLPVAYIADDLGWPVHDVQEPLDALVDVGFCERCSDGRHIVICKFLQWNPIENPNVGKAALRQLDHLPTDPAVEHVIRGLEAYSKQFPNGFGTVFERFRNTKPKPELDPEPEPEPKPESARLAIADQTSTAISAYNQLAVEAGWPQAIHITQARLAQLNERLKEAGGLEGWLSAMSKARASPFLRGETGRDRAHAKWTPDLDFFLKQSSFTKLMEGKYDDRSSHGHPTGFDALCAGARAAADC